MSEEKQGVEAAATPITSSTPAITTTTSNDNTDTVGGRVSDDVGSDGVAVMGGTPVEAQVRCRRWVCGGGGGGEGRCWAMIGHHRLKSHQGLMAGDPNTPSLMTQLSGPVRPPLTRHRAPCMPPPPLLPIHPQEAHKAVEADPCATNPSGAGSERLSDDIAGNNMECGQVRGRGVRVHRLHCRVKRGCFLASAGNLSAKGLAQCRPRPLTTACACMSSTCPMITCKGSHMPAACCSTPRPLPS